MGAKVYWPLRKEIVLNSALVLDGPLQVLNPRHGKVPIGIVSVSALELLVEGAARIPNLPCPRHGVEEHEGPDHKILLYLILQCLVRWQIVSFVSHRKQLERLAVHQVLHCGSKHCELPEAEALVSHMFFKQLNDKAGHTGFEQCCRRGLIPALAIVPATVEVAAVVVVVGGGGGVGVDVDVDADVVVAMAVAAVVFL